jgi:hypothetical protein
VAWWALLSGSDLGPDLRPQLFEPLMGNRIRRLQFLRK